MDYAKPNNGIVILKHSRKNKFQFPNNYKIKYARNIAHLIFIILNQKYSKIFTPTPHPIPFIKNQIIVFHDMYPFFNHRLSRLKRALVFTASLTCNLNIGHVNNLIKKSIKRIIYIPNSKFFFIPNYLSKQIQPKKYSLIKQSINFNIGLIGTESTKKSYEFFFTALRNRDILDIPIGIYGPMTDYAKYVLDEFKDLDIKIVNPDNIDLIQFMESCDRVVSVAKGEGFVRPIGIAIKIGVPVDVLDDPIFREFYTELITFHESMDSLINTVIDKKFFHPPKKSIDLFIKSLQNDFEYAKKQLFS